MTVKEAIRSIEGRSVGWMNRLSAQYAQTLLLPEEEVLSAVQANISARGERFPGIVVLTDRRVLAVCGLPGIRRSVIYEADEMEPCVETPSALNYKAIFSTKKSAFSMTIDPDTGEKFSRCIAVLNGQEEIFDAAFAHTDSSIFNPTLVRNKIRARQVRSGERVRRAAEQETLEHRRKAPPEMQENPQETAERLARQLAEAQARGPVSDTSPQAVAARLAAELAAAEETQTSRTNQV